MSYSDANRQRYAKDSSQASFLEAEWSDYLLGQDTNQMERVDPLECKAGPGFYQTVAKLTEGWSNTHDKPPLRCCDVGGSTGRTVYELARRIPSLVEFILVEPSSSLAQWARRILCNPTELDWIPVVHELQGVGWVRVRNRPENRFSKEKAIHIYQVDSDSVPRSPGYFDLITCLNVVDRVSNPKSLIQTLHRLLRPDGLLVLSSPLEFDEQFTPDREQWVTDLNDLLDESDWIPIDSANVIYDFRLYRRGWIRYSSQVVSIRRKSAGLRHATGTR